MEPSAEDDPPDKEPVLSPDELDISADENVAKLDEARFVVGADGPPDTESVESHRAKMGAADGTAKGTDAPGSQQANAAGDAGVANANQTAEEDAAVGAGAGAAGAGAGAAGAGAGAAADPGQATSDTGETNSVETTPSTETSQGAEITGSDVKRWLTRELARSENRYAYRIVAKTGDSIQHQQLGSDDIGVAFDSLLLWYARQVGEGTAIEEALGILLAESDLRVRYPTPRLLDYLDEHDLGPDDTIADLVNVVYEADGLVFPQGRRNQK